MEADKDCVLVYLTDFVETDDDFPSKFGGAPVWLAPPAVSAQLKCTHCKEGSLLTFLCQIYAPLEYNQAYHRVLYVFFCPNCMLSKRGIRVFRMQLPNQKLELAANTLECKLMAEEYSVTTDTLPAEEYDSINRKAAKQAAEQAEPDDDYVEIDEDNEEEYDQPTVKMPQDREDEMAEEVSRAKALAAPPADPVFETYRKVLHQLSDPIAIYFSDPLMFKKADFHIKQRRCQHCKGEMQIQLQINSTVLLKFQTLLSGDWGALYILTCKKSCAVAEGWIQEEVEVQIEQGSLTERVALEKELERRNMEQKKKQAKREKRRQKRLRKKQQQENKGDGQQSGSSEYEEVPKPAEEGGDWD